jgi:hypothetical protein
MKHEFIHKLSIMNLLWLKEEINSALKEKDPNEILEYIKKLELQQKKARNNKELDRIDNQIKILVKLSELQINS